MEEFNIFCLQVTGRIFIMARKGVYLEVLVFAVCRTV
jgi:hypothetical protein